MGLRRYGEGRAFAASGKAFMPMVKHGLKLPDKPVCLANTSSDPIACGRPVAAPETPCVLAQVEFPGMNTLFPARLVDVDPEAASLDWIGMKVKGLFRRLSEFKPTGLCFCPGG